MQDAAERDGIAAIGRLVEKGLMRAGDALSQRIPEQGRYIIATLGADGDVSFLWGDLTASPSELHHRIYVARPDVGAIFAGALLWTNALRPLRRAMPGVFDEQIRMLGREAALVRQSSSDPHPIAALATGANAYCLDDLALCFGMGMERLLLNIEILEKSAKSFVLAQASGGRVRQVPGLIRVIANGRLKKDQKAAAAAHLSGQRSVLKAGY